MTIEIDDNGVACVPAADEQARRDRRLIRQARAELQTGRQAQEILSPALAAIVTELRALSMAAPAVDADTRLRVAGICTQLESVLTLCRELGRDQRGHSLLRLGWLDSMHAELRALGAQHGIPLSMSAAADPDQVLLFAPAYRLYEFVQCACSAMIAELAPRAIELRIERRGTALMACIEATRAFGDAAAIIAELSELTAAELKGLAEEQQATLQFVSADSRYIATLAVPMANYSAMEPICAVATG